MPRRIAAPALADDLVSLEPLSRALVPDMQWLMSPDPEIAAFTYIPSSPTDGFLEHWLGRYEDGWATGERAGFAIRLGAEAAGFAAFVKLHLDEQEGEIGYLVAPGARGRGVASRALALLTGWGFGALGLQRIELRIDARNEASARVAERVGYEREGVLRNLAFKDGLRTDVAVWSRVSHR